MLLEGRLAELELPDGRLPTLLDGRLPPNEREGVALLEEGRLLPTLPEGRSTLPEGRLLLPTLP